MACYWQYLNETTLKIPDVEENNGITFYNIEVQIGDVKWCTKRRYNEFFELHQQLVVDHGVSKDLLPPKKVILNKSKAFIESRREALEIYLQNVLHYLKRAMPKQFWEFLDLHLYDIYFILQDMTTEHFSNLFKVTIDQIHEFTPLQLHAVSECLKQPILELDQMGKACNLSSILEAFSNLTIVKIIGSNLLYRNSNIILNSLPYELSSFKSLESLILIEVNLDKIYGVDNLRCSLKQLEVHQTAVTDTSKIFQCDCVHKKVIDKNQEWKNLTEADFSTNLISEVDITISLAPLLISLNLSDNKLTNFPNLSCLTNLKVLNLSKNLIRGCDNVHTLLGNVLEVDISQNRVESLLGFCKLYSLQVLNASHNNISNIEDAKYVGDLPCLEEVVLNGNPVAATVDYRVKILENFGDRAREISLDNERPTQAELDKASVLTALKLAKNKRKHE